MRTGSRFSMVSRVATLALAAVLAAPVAGFAAAKITVINGDGPDEGFNDPTPAAPIGGNPGTTRGQQRLIAFQYAADRWGLTLDSNVEIKVLAFFDALGANVLGQAGTNFILNNFGGDTLPGFPGPQYTDVWYHQALADKLAGQDLIALELADEPQLVAQFSSDFDFYLGLDNNHGARNDLVVVVMHELGHGLGFANFMTEATGVTPDNLPDIFMKNTFDTFSGKFWSEFTTNAERAAASLRVERAVWVGDRAVNAVDTTLSFGRPQVIIPTLGTFRIGPASFGNQLTAAGVTGQVVLANDGDPTPTGGTLSDACTPLANAAAVAGKIALVDRGVCTFAVKVKIAQDAGAIAVLVADNVAADPPAGLSGVDPTITIPSARITLTVGNSIKAALPAVTATMNLDLSKRAGADPLGFPQLYATNPVQPGSSISHWDTIAFPNQLMEPAINPDLTHEVIPPYDLTLMELRDIGWFTDANLDGKPDKTVILGQCNTLLRDSILPSAASLSEQARVWFRDCDSPRPLHFIACLTHETAQARRERLITLVQQIGVLACGVVESLR